MEYKMTHSHSLFHVIHSRNDLVADRTIKIYNVSEDAYEITATLQGHEGAVWQVSWAHPKFGVLLASCSFDGSVLIHREQRPGDWVVLHAARGLHTSSVNGVAFAPHEFGLQVAAASSDGRVSVLRHQPNHTWSVEYSGGLSRRRQRRHVGAGRGVRGGGQHGR